MFFNSDVKLLYVLELVSMNAKLFSTQRQDTDYSSTLSLGQLISPFSSFLKDSDVHIEESSGNFEFTRKMMGRKDEFSDTMILFLLASVFSDSVSHVKSFLRKV